MDKHVFLQGELLYLRALEEQDIDGNYFQWLNDEEVNEFNSHGVFPNTESGMKSYLRDQHVAKDKLVLAIIDLGTDKHIGNISLQSIDWVSHSAEFAILLGDKDYWGKGYSTEASLLLCNHGFEQLNLNRIYCGTSGNNIGMQKLAGRMKMQKEGVRREAMYKKGQFWDIWEYGVLKGEYYS